MKRLICNGARDVRVIDSPDLRIEKETGAPVQITSSNICGSGLRVCEGRARSR